MLSPYLLLTIVCIFNLSWNITDHDDGHTLGFHAMGRNPDIQRSYGAYDSMCDYLLGLLPINYKILLGSMVGATIISAYFILYLTGQTLKQWFKFTPNEISLGLLLFLVAMPEYLYMSLSFKSVYISLALILGAGYVLYNNTQSLKNIVISALIFGLGVSFRWNMIMMGAPFAALLVWELHKTVHWKKTIATTFIWGSLALIASILFVYISGYPPTRIVETYLWGKEYAEKTDFQLIARIGDLSLFFTPTTALLFSLATLYLIKNKTNRIEFILLLLSSLLAVALVTIAPSFKFLAPLWISFIALFILGIKQLNTYAKTTKQVVTILLAIAIGINWFLGIQISTPSSNWGPGLAAKDTLPDMSVFSKNLTTDSRFKFNNVQIGFYDGFALPTSEGYRPLYGHAYALFNDKLALLDEKLNKESDDILARATSPKTVIYQDRINPYLLSSYLKNGYTTNEFWNTKEQYVKRTLKNSTNTITELRITNPKELFDLNSFVNQVQSYDTIFLMFTYTSACNKFLFEMNETKNYHYTKIGPMSAVVWKDKKITP